MNQHEIASFDLTVARQKEAGLESELKKLRSAMEYAREHPVLNPLIPLASPLPPVILAPPAPPVQALLDLVNYKKRRGMTPGLRKAVTVALWTGPLDYEGLLRGVRFREQPLPIEKIREVVGAMFTEKLCFINEFGQFQLSPEGKKQAEFFQKHDDLLTYRPNTKRPPVSPADGGARLGKAAS